MRTCYLTVPENMTDETYRLLCEKTATRFGADIVFEKRVDSTLLGGFILELDGTVYDVSLRTQLEQLKAKMVYTEGQE